MERTSYFIKNKALFGSFPTQEAVEELEREGVRFFIDLTHSYEQKITPYKTLYRYISYPITDRRVPKDWRSFARFIIKIADIIDNLEEEEKIFVHCKGGHGRSGVVVACLLCYIYNITPEEALQKTSKFHSNRSLMREKWRKLGSPQTRGQKNFVYKFFNPFFFYRDNRKNQDSYSRDYTEGFSNYSDHTILYNNTIYPNAMAAINTAKLLIDLQEGKSVTLSRTPDKHASKDYYKTLCHKMYEILKCKFNQHLDLKHNLMNTGLRPLVYYTTSDSFWGSGVDDSGQNRLGIALYKLREYYYRNE
jgi:predicted NAD-dependent protein-ADP-ribosyltransferase YbiA (DUF1768 family)